MRSCGLNNEQNLIDMDEIAVTLLLSIFAIAKVLNLAEGTNELTEIYKLMEEQLRIAVVSQQRELLITALKDYPNKRSEHVGLTEERYVDKYHSNL